MKNSQSFFKTIILLLIFIFISSNFIVYATYIPDGTEYVWSESAIETSTNNASTNSEDFLDLTCESAILIEQTTGTILYEKNANTKLRPASVTKIMTILLIMEAIENRSNII